MSIQTDRVPAPMETSAPSDVVAQPAMPSRVAANPQVVRSEKRPADAHGMIHAIQSLLYIIIVAIFIITFTVQPFRIPSESMEPTLMVGDFLLVSKLEFPAKDNTALPYTPIRRGDVVVFHYPIDPSIHLVKRVIGMPGDHLRLRDGHVFIDGRALQEPYAVYRSSPPDNFRDNFPRLQTPDPDVTSNWWIQMRSLVNRGELTVPPRSYFVLGDNRNDSEDSRYWGFVPASAIVGRPLLVYFSLNEDSRDDDEDSLTPHASALPPPKPRQNTTIAHIANQIANFARWDRTLRVVR